MKVNEVVFEDDEEMMEEDEEKETKLSVDSSLYHTIDLNDLTVLFLKKKDQMVKICKINKVYGGLLLMLFHLRYLRLKTNGEDQNSKRQKT
jgi:hypothetical protein